MCFLQHILITALQTVSEYLCCSGGFLHDVCTGAAGFYSQVIWLPLSFSALVTQVCPWLRMQTQENVSAGLPGWAPSTGSGDGPSLLRVIQAGAWIRCSVVPSELYREPRLWSCPTGLLLLGSVNTPGLDCCNFGSCLFPAGSMLDPSKRVLGSI